MSSLMKSWRKSPAVSIPPIRSPMFAMSAMGESRGFAQFNRQWHRPELLADHRGRVDDVVAKIVVVTHHCRNPVSEGDHLGACQGRDVDDDVGFVFPP